MSFYYPSKNVDARLIVGFFFGLFWPYSWYLVLRYDHESLRENVVHRKFRHLATGIDCNSTGTPLEIGTSLVTAGEKNRMTFLGRDKRLFTGRNGHHFDRYVRPRIRKLLAAFLSRPGRLSGRRKGWKVQINYDKTDGIFDANDGVICDIEYEAKITGRLSW